MIPPKARPGRLRIGGLYALAILKEFRATLLTTLFLVVLGTFLFAITPHEALKGGRPDLFLSAFGAWMSLFGQVLFNPPETWYLELLHGLYPVLGFVVLGEGVVRFALLMSSRRRGEREWRKVMASTYRDHVVVCGLGHLGVRVIEQLLASGVQVVGVERDADAPELAALEAKGVTVIPGDMRLDSVLQDAGIRHARAVVAATNEEMTNLEVAMDARRLNPSIRVLLRFHDHAIAQKIQNAFNIDAAFSAEALAAPVIAAMALGETQAHPAAQNPLLTSPVAKA